MQRGLAHDLSRDQNGAVVVEAAIVFPFLVVLAFGVLEFANMFYGHQLISQNVRDATRFLARTNTPTVTAAAFNIATRKDVGLQCPPVTNCILPWFQPAQMSAAVTEIGNPVDEDGKKLYRGGASIQVVTVTATVTYPGIALFPAIGLDQTIQFTVTHSERVIGE